MCLYSSDLRYSSGRRCLSPLQLWWPQLSYKSRCRLRFHSSVAHLWQWRAQHVSLACDRCVEHLGGEVATDVSEIRKCLRFMLLIIGKQQWSTNQYWSTLFINSSRQNEIKQYKKIISLHSSTEYHNLLYNIYKTDSPRKAAVFSMNHSKNKPPQYTLLINKLFKAKHRRDLSLTVHRINDIMTSRRQPRRYDIYPIEHLPPNGRSVLQTMLRKMSDGTIVRGRCLRGKRGANVCGAYVRTRRPQLISADHQFYYR